MLLIVEWLATCRLWVWLCLWIKFSDGCGMLHSQGFLWGGVCVQGCSAVAAPQVCHIMITLMNKKTCAIPIHMLCVILFMPLTFWVSFLPVPNWVNVNRFRSCGELKHIKFACAVSKIVCFRGLNLALIRESKATHATHKKKTRSELTLSELLSGE